MRDCSVAELPCDTEQIASFDVMQFATPDVTSRPELGDSTLQALIGSNAELTLQVSQGPALYL